MVRLRETHGAIMARRKLLGLMALGGSLLPASAAASAETGAEFRKLDKALWIWRTGLAEAGSVAHFMAAWNFDTALLSVPPEERASVAAVRDGLAPLRAASATILLAAGDPNWSRRAPDMQVPRKLLALADLAARGGVHGLILDVEPQMLPEWKGKERAALAAGFVALMTAVQRELRLRELALWVTVHPSHAQTADPDQAGRTMFDATLGVSDHIVTMAYRVPLAAGLDLAAPLLRSLERQPVPWHFGVTTEPPAAGQRHSYGGMASSGFQQAMTALDTVLRNSVAAASYRGIAINHFRPTASLLS